VSVLDMTWYIVFAMPDGSLIFVATLSFETSVMDLWYQITVCRLTVEIDRWPKSVVLSLKGSFGKKFALPEYTVK
jgi:hypothetical protein